MTWSIGLRRIMVSDKRYFLIALVCFACVNGCGNTAEPGYSKERRFRLFKREIVNEIVYRTNNSTRVVKNVDLASFKTLGHEKYAVDKFQAYHEGIAIASSHPATFTSLSDHHAVDQNHVYAARKIISGVDRETFNVVSEHFSKDKNKVFKSHRAIPEADVNSFEVISGHYSRDRNYCYYDTIAFVNSGHDPLEIMGMGYSKTDDQVFHAWHNVELIYNYPQEDDFTITADIQEVVGADPNTFETIEIETGNFLNQFAKDSTHVYWHHQIIESANPGAFEHISGHLTRDDQSYFYLGAKMEEVDYESFEIHRVGQEGYTPGSLGKDRNHVYRGNVVDPQLTPALLNSRARFGLLQTIAIAAVILINLLVAWKLKKKGCLLAIVMIILSLVAFGFVMMFNMAVKQPLAIFILALIASTGVPILFYVLTRIDPSKVLNPPQDTGDFLNNPRFSYARGKIIIIIIVVVIAILTSLYNWVLHWS